MTGMAREQGMACRIARTVFPELSRKLSPPSILDLHALVCNAHHKLHTLLKQLCTVVFTSPLITNHMRICTGLPVGSEQACFHRHAFGTVLCVLLVLNITDVHIHFVCCSTQGYPLLYVLFAPRLLGLFILPVLLFGDAAIMH